MKGCHTTGLILSAILGIGLSLIYHYQPIEIRLKTPTENAIKNHYANYSYRDPFEDIALTTDERYIFNYAIAQLFLEDQFKNKPYGIPRYYPVIVEGVEHMFHVKHLSLLPLDEQQEALFKRAVKKIGKKYPHAFYNPQN